MFLLLVVCIGFFSFAVKGIFTFAGENLTLDVRMHLY